MFALCPKCGEAIEDNGYAEFITCASCGQSIKSRAHFDKHSDGQQKRPPRLHHHRNKLLFAHEIAEDISRPQSFEIPKDFYAPKMDEMASLNEVEVASIQRPLPPPPNADQYPPYPPAGHRGEVPIYYTPPPQSPPDYYRGYNYYPPPRTGRPKAIRGSGHPPCFL